MKRGDAPVRDQLGLPPRPFLYTIDQIATLIGVEPATIRTGYLHYDRRSVGKRPLDTMLAHNIAPEGSKPEWRVAERELVRFLRGKGFRLYERGWVNY